MPQQLPKFSKAQWATQVHSKMRSWITGSKKNAPLKKRWAPAFCSTKGSLQAGHLCSNNGFTFSKHLPVSHLLMLGKILSSWGQEGFKHLPMGHGRLVSNAPFRMLWAFVSPLIIRHALHQIWFYEMMCWHFLGQSIVVVQQKHVLSAPSSLGNATYPISELVIYTPAPALPSKRWIMDAANVSSSIFLKDICCVLHKLRAWAAWLSLQVLLRQISPSHLHG